MDGRQKGFWLLILLSPQGERESYRCRKGWTLSREWRAMLSQCNLDP